MANLILLFWYLGLPGLLCFDYLSNSPFVGGLDAIPYLWSISLYFWMLGNVVLGSKIPLVQRLLPYDKRISYHVLASFGIILGFCIHFLTKIFMGKELDLIAWILLISVSSLFLLSAYWVRVPLLSVYRTLMAKLFRHQPDRIYDQTRILHGLLFPAAAFLMFFHIRESGIQDQGTWISTWGYTLAFGLATAIYLFSQVRKLFRVRGVVVELTERQGVTIIKIEPQRPLKYRAGQFAFISFPGHPGLGRSHPFSFLSSPNSETTGDHTVWFAVKDSGDFTSKIKNIKPGSKVTIDGSYGDFRPKKDEPTCLIGTGIGSVPILSLLGEEASEKTGTYAILGCDVKEDIPWMEELHPGLDGPGINILEYKKTGQVVDEVALKTLPGDIAKYRFYLCCSPGVRKSIVTKLLALGVPKRQIVFENFSF